MGTLSSPPTIAAAPVVGLISLVSGSQLITNSWSDCDSMINHAITLQLADPSRLTLAGHSSGGYLSALGATTSKDKYKACVTWSGASDLFSLAGTSQTPEFQSPMSGLAPWYSEPLKFAERCKRQNGPSKSSAKPGGCGNGILDIAWENDPQVPLLQAVVLFKGLNRLSKFPEPHLLAVYPNEGHVFAEKAHLEDALLRILEHLATYSA